MIKHKPDCAKNRHCNLLRQECNVFHKDIEKDHPCTCGAAEYTCIHTTENYLRVDMGICSGNRIESGEYEQLAYCEYVLASGRISFEDFEKILEADECKCENQQRVSRDIETRDKYKRRFCLSCGKHFPEEEKTIDVGHERNGCQIKGCGFCNDLVCKIFNSEKKNTCPKSHCRCMQITPCGNHHYSDCGKINPSVVNTPIETLTVPQMVTRLLKSSDQPMFFAKDGETVAALICSSEHWDFVIGQFLQQETGMTLEETKHFLALSEAEMADIKKVAKLKSLKRQVEELENEIGEK